MKFIFTLSFLLASFQIFADDNPSPASGETCVKSLAELAIQYNGDFIGPRASYLRRLDERKQQFERALANLTTNPRYSGERAGRINLGRFLGKNLLYKLHGGLDWALDRLVRISGRENPIFYANDRYWISPDGRSPSRGSSTSRSRSSSSRSSSRSNRRPQEEEERVENYVERRNFNANPTERMTRASYEENYLSTQNIGLFFPGVALKVFKEGEDALDPMEQAVWRIAKSWKDRMISVHTDLREILDEYAALLSAKEEIKILRNQPDFAEGGNTSRWMEVRLKEEGEWRTVRIRPYDSSEVQAALDRIDFRIQEIESRKLPQDNEEMAKKGSFFVRVIEQARLHDRNEVVRNYLDDFLGNLEAHDELQDLMTEDGLNFLQQFRMDLNALADRRYNRRIFGDYDISEFGIMRTTSQQFVTEFYDIIFNQPPFRVLGRFAGWGADRMGVSWGRSLIWRMENTTGSQVQSLYERMTSNAQRRQFRVRTQSESRIFRLGTAGLSAMVGVYGTTQIVNGNATEAASGAVTTLWGLGLDFAVETHYRFWGSADQCIEVETPDLQTFEHQPSRGLFTRPRNRSTGIDLEDGTTEEEFIAEFHRRDQNFKMCIYNHLMNKYDTSGDDLDDLLWGFFIGRFDINSMSEEERSGLMGEMNELRARRFSYFVRRVEDDLLKARVAEFINGLPNYDELQSLGFSDCAYVGSNHDNLYACIADEVNALEGFEEIEIDAAQIMDSEAVWAAIQEAGKGEAEYILYEDTVDAAIDENIIVNAFITTPDDAISSRPPRRSSRRSSRSRSDD